MWIMLGQPISNRFWLIMAAHGVGVNVNGPLIPRARWHITYAVRIQKWALKNGKEGRKSGWKTDVRDVATQIANCRWPTPSRPYLCPQMMQLAANLAANIGHWQPWQTGSDPRTDGFSGRFSDKAHFICTENRLQRFFNLFPRVQVLVFREFRISSEAKWSQPVWLMDFWHIHSVGDLWSHLLRLFWVCFCKRHSFDFLPDFNCFFLRVSGFWLFDYGFSNSNSATLTSSQLRPFCVIQFVMCPLLRFRCALNWLPGTMMILDIFTNFGFTLVWFCFYVLPKCFFFLRASSIIISFCGQHSFYMLTLRELHI